MSSEFERDLANVRRRLEADRAALRDAVAALSDADLDRGRRGGWAVRRVLDHVIQSEWLYSKLMHHLCGRPVPTDETPGAPSSVADALRRLEASRAALLAALDGIDEETFYRLQTVGHEEYSPLSLLENTAMHDQEHTAQIQEILAAM